LRLRTRVAAYGLAGLMIAGTAIFAGSSMGLLNSNSSGILSVLLTDPPSVPDGVTAVYITYSNIAVHASGFGDSGWVDVPGSGTIDTLGLVNFSRTISTAQVPILSYNLVAFNISSTTVDYMGTNYTVGSNSGRLTIPFVAALKVNASIPAAALVDISPTVLNLGSTGSPSFTMAAGAKALQVPSIEVKDSMKTVGSEFSLQGHSWFQSFTARHSDNVTLSRLALTSNSFSFSVSNPGSDAVTLRMVEVTRDPATPKAGAALNSVATSFDFAVGADGSLSLLSGATGVVGQLSQTQGYTLAGGASKHFSYAGGIATLLGENGITAGTAYDVFLIGSGTLAVQTVVAT
jgi:uncharacterized protein DUF4382